MATLDSVTAVAPAPDSLTATLVVIDRHIPNCETLAAGALPGAAVLLLDPDYDGVEQITQAFQRHPDITTLHLFALGYLNSLKLGNAQLNLKTIDQYAWDLQAWFPASSFPYSPSSFLIYASHLSASTDTGSQFLQKLHTLTGATLHTLTPKEGNSEQGSTWQLDITFPPLSTPTTPALPRSLASTVLTLSTGNF